MQRSTRIAWNLALTLLMCLCSVCFSSPELLVPGDVQRIMGALLEYHVKIKEVTPELLGRSYEIYIQQFDPDRLYLLETEVRPFLEPSKEELEAALHRYQLGDISDYGRLDSVIQRAIHRARGWREALMVQAAKELLRDESAAEQAGHPSPIYCSSEQHLRLCQQQDLIRFGVSRAQKFRVSRPYQERLQEAWEIYTKQANQKERPYLYQDANGQIMSSEMKQHVLVERVLKALAQSLDSHTAYYSPSEAYQLRMQLQQEYTGVGLELAEAARGVEVLKVLEGGPAARSGKIQPQDKIVGIDGEQIAQLPYQEVLGKLRGPRGSWVVLEMERPDEQVAVNFTVRLQRDHLPVNPDELASTYQRYGEGVIALIRLDSFYEGLGVSAEQDVRQALERFKQQGPLLGVVLDLRMNLGGFLSQAVKVAGLFITNGVIAMSRYSDGVEVFFRDIDGVAVYDGPLIVLTSRASASAAEIVAQSLQDYGQALVVGDARTYGKGSIQHQTITDPAARDYYKVTVGRYYTVSGRSTQVTGVQADIVVPTILYQEPIGEEYLEYPLEADQIQPAFNDSLQDLDPILRSWFAKYYLPTLQRPRSTWKQHLPILKKNSEHRLRTSQNYQFFLQAVEKGGARELMRSDGVARGYGRDDLQLIEAVNILKDMILLHAAEPDAA